MIVSFSSKLLLWYGENRRTLPWRGISDPYKIWLSEIILQQTRIVQGEPYYLRFVEHYPTVRHLADASEEEVLKLWQGLGYYSRARNLHKAAQVVRDEYGGVFPSSFEQIRALPGVGDYTAAAIASFAFNLPYPVVDGNVIRFITRLEGIFEEATSPACRKRILEILKERLDVRQAGLFNQALMEFGALACTPQNPLCKKDPKDCPFGGDCYALAHDVASELPVKKRREVLPVVNLHYLYLEEKGCVWVHKRGYDDLWRGMYDLPVWKAAEAQNSGACGEAAEPVAGLTLLKEYRQTLSHRRLHVFFYEVQAGSPLATQIGKSGAYRKVDKKTLSQLAVPKNIATFFHDFNIF
ncbi:MAG: A/G-specific adenine glycosylase [Bacteroidales bacterium]|nr:A/G-specific adenine glycosylase [Bacteroidales bacterium]